MFKQVDEEDLALFVRLADEKRPETRADVPTHVLIPAFLISELKTAFQIGFLIFIPFLIIDMVVASTLMSMGMIMLPPVMISLPFKILLFVLVDGWGLTIESLVESFGTGGLAMAWDHIVIANDERRRRHGGGRQGDLGDAAARRHRC